MDVNGQRISPKSKEKLKQWFFIGFGVLFLLVPTVANVWVLERVLTQDGDLSGAGAIIVWLFDILMVFWGGAFIWYHKTLATYLHFSKTALVAWVLVIFIMLGALEISARVIDAIYDGNFSGERERLANSDDIVPYRIFGFYQYGWDEHGEVHIRDSHGDTYPFTKPEGGIRIVAFGGSTTEQEAPGTTHYPKLLEERLGASFPEVPLEVINIGNVGYATPHSLTLLMLDVLSWDPDVVILSHNINDLITAYTPGFVPDYSHVFGLPVYTRGSGDDSIVSALFGWTTLYWVVRHQFGTIGLPLIRETLLGTAYREKPYGEDPPAPAAEIFRRNLTTFADVAKESGATVIFGTQPFAPNNEYWDRTMRFYLTNDIVVYPPHNEITLHHAHYNDIIRDVAKKEDVHLVDNAASFGGTLEYFYDHVHYTKEGLENLAENYFEYIVKSNIITK